MLHVGANGWPLSVRVLAYSPAMVFKFEPRWTADRRVRVAVLVIAALLVLQVVGVVADLARSPRRDVPEWLHVTDADITRGTHEIQVMLVMSILVLGTQAVVLALRRCFLRAVAGLALLAWWTATVIFTAPALLLGTRYAQPPLNWPGSADPIPVSTDFDYATYLPRLLDAVIAPGLWSLLAAGALGGIIAAGISAYEDRRPRPSSDVKDGATA